MADVQPDYAFLGEILHPMVQNKWALKSFSGLDEDELRLLQLQLVKCKFVYTSNTMAARFGLESLNSHKLVVHFEEPVSNELAPLIEKIMLLTEPFDIVIDQLDGNITVLKTTTYRGCTAESYTYSLDYAKSKSCVYPVTFSVKSVEVS